MNALKITNPDLLRDIQLRTGEHSYALGSSSTGVWAHPDYVLGDGFTLRARVVNMASTSMYGSPLFSLHTCGLLCLSSERVLRIIKVDMGCQTGASAITGSSQAHSDDGEQLQPDGANLDSPADWWLLTYNGKR